MSGSSGVGSGTPACGRSLICDRTASVGLRLSRGGRHLDRMKLPKKTLERIRKIRRADRAKAAAMREVLLKRLIAKGNPK